MNFKQLKDITYNYIDEVDLDEQVQIVVSHAINKAYLDLCHKDKRLATAYVPIINGIAKLPDNCIGLVNSNPVLDIYDKQYGNTIVTNKTGVLEVLYSYVREPLETDEDEPDLHLTLQYALVSYACFKYFEHRKKTGVANTFFDNYMQEISSFQDQFSYVPETITEVEY